MAKRRLLLFTLFAGAALFVAASAPIAASAATAAPSHAVASHAVAAPRGVLRGGPAIPLSGVGCSGDACINLGNVSNGKVTVRGCAWKTTVYHAHIEISGPGGTGLPKNSGTGTWTKTSNYCSAPDKYFSVTVPAVVGQYCSTTWNGSSYDGTACESVE
jgi:hypothetical protein